MTGPESDGGESTSTRHNNLIEFLNIHIDVCYFRYGTSFPRPLAERTCRHIPTYMILESKFSRSAAQLPPRDERPF